jgi:colicin import membrane protein
MTRLLHPAVLLALAALVAFGAVGCNRSSPSSNQTAAKDAGKPAQAAPQSVASLPSAPATAPQAPAAPPLPPPAPEQRMTNAQEADFDAWIVKAYLGCWNPPPQPAESDPYVAYVRLAFKRDGSLAKAPKLVNPPADPALKPQAKSVLQAVHACNPLPVPAQYRPFYEQWKTKTIHFNPQVAAR